MRRTNKTSQRPTTVCFICALLFLACASFTSSTAQEAGRRPSRSLTSEDLLNRPTLYIPPAPATAAESSASSSSAGRSADGGGNYYRDPMGAFTLSFPNNSWRVNASRAGSSGRVNNLRSFRRVEPEGFASATANIYILNDRNGLLSIDPQRLSADEQRGLAQTLATRFLSSNASLVSVEPFSSSSALQGLRIVADQTIARRVVVRAAIHIFEREGRIYVVVCCASPETFDATEREFDAITNSLASSVMRS